MSGKSGAMILSFALSIAAAVGLSAIPSVAAAQVDSGTLSQTAPDGGVQDCTNGCYISTCSGSTCTIWYCNSAGCKVVGQYQKIGPNSEAAVGALAFQSYDDVAYAKTCSGDRCKLYEPTPTKVTQIGYIENIKEIVRELRAKHVSGGA